MLPMRLPSWFAESSPVDRCGLTGLMLFAWGTFGGTAAGYVGLLVMLLATLPVTRHAWSAMRDHAVTLSCFANFMFVAALTIVFTHGVSEEADLQRSAGVELATLFLFPLVAWWMRGNPRIVVTVLAVALAGFLYGRAVRIDAAVVNLALVGGRVGLGLPGIAFSQYCGAGLVGVSIALPRVWSSNVLTTAWRIAAVVLLGLIWISLLGGLIQGGSRGAYLNVLAVAAILWASRRKSPHDSRQARRWMILVSGLLLAVLAYEFGWLIVARFHQAYQEVTILFDEGIEAVKGSSSVGVRALMLLAGIDWWSERPWFGWGPGATEHLIQISGIAQLGKFKDLHNGPLELAVRLGAIGLGLFAINWSLVFRDLVLTRRVSTMPEPLYRVILGCLLLHLIGTLYDFRMLNADWLLYWLLFAGAATTFSLHGNRAD